MHLFYTPDITLSAQQYTLSEEESKHCCRVLRLEAGDQIYLIDGKGGFFTGRIDEANPKRVKVEIVDKTEGYGKRNHYLHMAVAPTKNIDRFEWFLEKATEIGIDEITPLICDRSERKEVKIDRLNKVITSAVKQSVTAYHPVLNEPKRMKDLLSQDFSGQKFIAHCEEDAKQELRNTIHLKNQYLILIGPEGDFSTNEISQSLKSGFIPVTLGNTRLRTETAALEACFEVNFLHR
ncbi:16S rRNA (uracil(1498)-N(3))-methyltransferase [Pedobacter sp. HMF7647]|uniref:Ribosomal RNA small subunit methyltransferase E n=1 Tax=Hufsiella arboris TaxID=2695275 RepID=A0A7K1YAN9_9SPHI|nr:16S rRNA (uracil(1498)-N(3))-methyltransferase [Hufsiella arboris]MXV51646.1 16S rRNA (uracil(1498)-N(3))-methyltransferase [Hufsiella arboris]